MNRISLIVLLGAGLAGCASDQRTEPPAPVVTAGSPAAESTRATPSAPPPSEDAVEIYAYRPPSSAPDAAVSTGSVPAEDALSTAGGPISESAPTGAGSNTDASVPPAETTSAPAPRVVAYAPPPPPAPSLQPAADALLKQAEQQRQARDYVGAAATLERALGIQPQEPYVWNRLARVRMEQGLYSQAGNLASRSNALAGDQVALKQDNWGIIAAARRAAGDTAGAMEAEQKARGG